MRKKRLNGRILTVKNLAVRDYAVIHKLPRGFRQHTMKALLSAAADLSLSNPEWFKHAVAGHLKLSVTRSK